MECHSEPGSGNATRRAEKAPAPMPPCSPRQTLRLQSIQSEAAGKAPFQTSALFRFALTVQPVQRNTPLAMLVVGVFCNTPASKHAEYVPTVFLNKLNQRAPYHHQTDALTMHHWRGANCPAGQRKTALAMHVVGAFCNVQASKHAEYVPKTRPDTSEHSSSTCDSCRHKAAPRTLSRRRDTIADMPEEFFQRRVDRWRYCGNIFRSACKVNVCPGGAVSLSSASLGLFGT